MAKTNDNDPESASFPVPPKLLMWLLIIAIGGGGGLGSVQVWQTSSIDSRLATFEVRQNIVVETLNKQSVTLEKISEGVNGHSVTIGELLARTRHLEEALEILRTNQMEMMKKGK